MHDPTKEGQFLDLMDVDLDRHIYRIMPESFVISMFNNNENFLSKIGNWKDKFENFQLNLGGSIQGQSFDYSYHDDFVGQCWTSEKSSEAMWGIYANDSTKRYLRIRSTPRLLLKSLASAHPKMPQDTCFFGRVQYLKEADLQAHAEAGGQLILNNPKIASNLLLKRKAFKHENEVRLLYFGEAKDYDAQGLYRYVFDPHTVITQIMGDPNRDRTNWTSDKTALQSATGFKGKIKRSKIYDPPSWKRPSYTS